VSVRLVWLGQASVRLELDGTRLLVDPWYSPHESRLIPIPDLEDAAGADAILITHEHLDHLDEPFLPTLRERSPHARVILPRCLTSRVDGVFESVAGVEPGDKLEIGGIDDRRRARLPRRQHRRPRTATAALSAKGRALSAT